MCRHTVTVLELFCNMGILSGDQSMHLLWRLQHGQVFVQHQPHLAFVMIGTNDLGAASCLDGETGILQAAAGTVQRYFPHVPPYVSSCMSSVTGQRLWQHMDVAYTWAVMPSEATLRALSVS